MGSGLLYSQASIVVRIYYLAWGGGCGANNHPPSLSVTLEKNITGEEGGVCLAHNSKLQSIISEKPSLET